MDYEKILESLKICSEVGTSCEGCSGRGERHCIANLTKAAAIAIETLLHALDMARRERDAVTRHMIELEQDVCRLKSRLAAYEDSGLEPEQVLELKSFTLGGIHKVDSGWKHVQDLIQAEQEGRLVVLPQKTVWELTMDAGPDCDMKCPVDAWDESFGCDLCSKAKQFANERPCTQDLLKELGKTVFLTREDAEAALAQKGDSEQ